MRRPNGSGAVTGRAMTEKPGESAAGVASSDAASPRAPAHDTVAATAGSAALRNKATRARRTVLALIVLLGLGFLAGLLLLERDEGPTTLTVAAGPLGSDSFTLMRETAAVLRRHSETLRLRVRATRGSSRNMALLTQGRVDLATVRSDTPVAEDVRTVADLFPDYFQIITGPGVRLRSVNDLEFVRIAIPPHGTEENRSFHMLLDHYDVDARNVRWRAMPFASAARMLLAGDIDALFTVRSLRDGGLLQLFEDASLSRKVLGFVPVRQAAAIAVKRPFVQVASIPQGVYTGSNPTPRVNMQTASVTRVLVTRDDVPEDAIRELARVLFGHKLDLTVRFSLAAAIEPPGGLDGTSTAPVHDGAQSWFDRDEPSFVQENAEPLALGVTVFTLMLSLLLGLRARLNSVQKNRLDAYNYDLLDLGERARAAEDVAALDTLKAQHFAVLERVVRALDTDEVTEEGFQSFSLLWGGVREIIEDRRRELGGTSSFASDRGAGWRPTPSRAQG